MPSQAANQHNTSINLPILYLPQLLGLAMGMDANNLGLKRNLVSPASVLEKMTRCM